MEKSEQIWMDGRLVPWAEANVHVLTHTLHYGYGVFEGIRCYRSGKKKSAIFRLQEHVKRLFDGAKILDIEIPYNEKQITQAIIQTVQANKLEECYIRPIVFLGDNKMGLNPTGVHVRVAIAAWPWGTYLGDDGLEKGIRVRISSFNRHHINVIMTKAKACGYYINSIFAKAEAVRDGYDEALLLDTNGYVTEGSGENIFIYHKGMLMTPPLSTGILDGITRNAVVQIAKHLKIPLEETVLTRDELYIANEIFLTGTAAEVTPVREVDNRIIGDGKRGKITKQIQDMFFQVVAGKQAKFKHWLTEV
ncbi:branched-chain amino acid transaminase [Nitrospina gracilis]|uniref:branched-chain amino acid transaminase n=1 Tax=Nitrospina gracilis TaxID=35801 RepID=UPI001F00FFB8|nr:branched-chain amino acid aminotransferase [Nitrospina gracilis Nb-211]